MNEIYEKSLLLDFYGELLTDKQREICYLSMTEDWSLGEIASSLNISRQGVQDTLKRSEKILLSTEEKLHMAARFVQLLNDVYALEDLVNSDSSKEAVLRQINALKEELLPFDSASDRENVNGI